MDENDFTWSDDYDQMVYQDKNDQYSFSLSIEMSTSKPTNEELALAKKKAAINFPAFLAKEPSHKMKAHQQIHEAINQQSHEAIKTDDYPDFESFSKQMILIEACLVDGEEGHFYYNGSGESDGYTVTIFCNGLEFDGAEIGQRE